MTRHSESPPPRGPAASERTAARSRAAEYTNAALNLSVPVELIEQVAARAAELVDARPAEPDGYLDVKGAAKFLSCPVSRIYALVSAHRIPHHRDGSRLLFDRAELRQYVEAGGAKRP